MPVTKTSLFGDYPSTIFEALMGTPIDKLRRQRKADCKPKKPKPVTDDQLLAIADELEAKIKALTKQLEDETVYRKAEDASAGRFVARNFKLKWFAPVKKSVIGLERYTLEKE